MVRKILPSLLLFLIAEAKIHAFVGSSGKYKKVKFRSDPTLDLTLLSSVDF